MDNKEFEQLSYYLNEAQAGQRLDQVLATIVPEFSRSRLQKWINDGNVTVDGERKRPKYTVRGGEHVELIVPIEEETDWQAEKMDLDILYQDEDILVINKSAGLVVHPGAGNRYGTLTNGLLYHLPSLKRVPRAGIVHRLDKDTSGVLVVACHLHSHQALVKQLQARAFERSYQAVVNRVMTSGGSIDAAVGRHPNNRLKMAVRENGKPAITHYRVIQRYRAHTHVAVKLETGRTHQIRVHMAHIRYPIVGDPSYGRGRVLPAGCGTALTEVLRSFSRQALHAIRLGLIHPVTKETMQWNAPLPQDFQQLLEALDQDLKSNRADS